MDHTTTTTTTDLKRRTTIPSAVIVPNSHPRPPDLEFLPLKSPLPDSYISLKDLMIPSSPATVMSPTPASPAVSGAVTSPHIFIRNRLVKQAAWAYLQPAVSTSPNSSARPLLAGVRRFLCQGLDFLSLSLLVSLIGPRIGPSTAWRYSVWAWWACFWITLGLDGSAWALNNDGNWAGSGGTDGAGWASCGSTRRWRRADSTGGSDGRLGW